MNASPNYLPVRDEWLRLRNEEILEPALPIVDAHHHFYDRPGWRYLRDDYAADARSGHAVRASVYMQALTRYRSAGPDALKPVGETEYVAAATASDSADSEARVAAGIVGYADLRLGAAVRDVLEAHLQAGRGRFRGIRHLTTWDADASLANPLTGAPAGLLLDSSYRAGLAQLAPLGLTYDAWLFFPQLPELIATARGFPETTFIVDHCGGVVRIGTYHDRGDEVFERWRASMRELARLPNVHVKLGGLGMRINGSASTNSTRRQRRSISPRSGSPGSRPASRPSASSGACSKAIFRSTKARTVTRSVGTPSSG
jgi:L-fuconolactonase